MQPLDIQYLIQQLQSKNVKTRQQAAIALGYTIHPGAIKPLIAALNDKDATVRANAAAALGPTGAPEARDPLIERLQKDRSPLVRQRAVTALAQLNVGGVWEAFLAALNDPVADVRNYVIIILSTSFSTDIVEPLIKMLAHKDRSTQAITAQALGMVQDSRITPAVLPLLKSPDVTVRRKAVFALGEQHDPQAIAPLLQLLQDADPLVRGETAWALGTISHMTGDTSMEQPLIALLQDFSEVGPGHAHTFVCEYAAEALQGVDTESALAALEAWEPQLEQALLPYELHDLIEALEDDDPEQRDQAVIQLHALGAAAVPALLDALQYEQVLVRREAVRALGDIGAAQAAQPLLALFDDPDGGVWSQTTAALAKIGAPAVPDLQQAMQTGSERAKLGAALALWRIQRDEAAFKWVLVAMQHDDVLIRGSAISSMWLQPDERAIATLTIMLNKEADATMQKYMLQALQYIGTPAAQTVIVNWMQANPPTDASDA